uniref:chitinase n=1 Tax=Bionectria ochroleuca TaxID=29856 RepID=A0A8H7K5J4_BIOOC
MAKLLTLVCLLCLSQLGRTIKDENEDKLKTSAGLLNAVYFTNWGIYGGNFQPADIPVTKISHVLYAFANLYPDGTVYPGDSYADLEKRYSGDSWDDTGKNAYGCVKQLYTLKRANRHIKLVLSIGGWTWSQNFASVAASEETRSTFAQTAVALMKDWGFDGIDIDWEYPASEKQGEDLLLLLQAIRQELDRYASQHANDHHFQLSIAAPAGPQHFEKLPLGKLGNVIDNFYLMAYDYAGSFSQFSGHQANLYADDSNPNVTPFSTDAAIKAYSRSGVPPSKIILGMPIYGRSFQNTVGLGQVFTGVGGGSWEKGVWDYKVLPKLGAEVKHDGVSGAYYSYDGSSKELVTFDTTDAVLDKIQYIHKLGLGGSMFWEASADKNDTSSLIATSYSSLGNIDSSPNWLDYPTSQYLNIATGMGLS